MVAITQFTNLPARSQNQLVFAAKADNFLEYQLPRFVDETNALAVELLDGAEAAIASAQSAALSERIALAAVGSMENYRGHWSDLSGPLPPLSSVWHKGRLWLLMGQVADVALAEPGVDTVAWGSTTRRVIVAAGNVQALADDEIMSVSEAISVTLPVAPLSGDAVSVARSGPGLVTILRNGATIHNTADDLVIDQKNRRVRLIYAGGTWRVSIEAIFA